jgi:two-component system CheB/CheR fusion protein
METNIPLVIIGGSAGSLKPLQELFSSIPSDCEAAFLVIQHMSPDHESHLDQLIAKRTSMPVEKLKEGMEPLANQVLVSLPGQFPILHDTYHYISAENTHRPIDLFCESLSTERAANTSLIILSGTGRDGRNGALRLKKFNGTVIIQEPSTATFPSMPEMVLEENIADLVLPPSKIGEVINILQDHDKLSTYLQNNDAQKADLLEFENILSLVKEHAKQDMSAYKPSTLRRRIYRRMGLHHVEELSQYHNLLLQNTDELEQLSKDLLIGVTAFFRDLEAFKILEEQVIPELCRNRQSNSPVRVWVAGCSTGEEAYSIAILLMQCFVRLGETARIQIFATDIDDAALEVARNGVYPKESLAIFDKELIKSYFIEDKGDYRINKSVRESIVFASHNLITDPPFSKLDMVVCRNLLIYLNSVNQKKLLSLFHFVLNSAGYLFLGSSENIGNIGRHFKAISKQWRIYHHTDAAPRRPPVLPINVGITSSRDGQSSLSISGSLISQERYYRQLIESYGPVQILINHQHQLLYVSGPTEPYLSIPGGQASHDLLKITRPSLSVSLRSAISQADTENKRIVVYVNVENEPGKNESVPIRIEVLPIGLDDKQDMFLVVFSPSPIGNATESIKFTGGDDWVLKQLVQEVNATREDLQRTIELSRVSQEEMRASNEEVMAMNEELQSANEELESSKEELQSLNEELATSNSNLDAKVSEVEALNSDLMNLMLSTEEAIVMVDEDLLIRHFTPACVGIMRIISSDIGRNIDDVVRLIPDPDLSKDCRECLKGFRTKDKEICNDEDKWFLRRLKPYRTADGRISGAVISFIDVTDIKQADKLLNEKAVTLEWQSSLLSKAAPIVGRDFNDNIIFWNNGAENLYGWQSHEVLGRQIQTLLNTEFPLPFEKIKAQLFDKGFWKGELLHTTKDSKTVIVDSQWTLFRDEAGEAKAIVEVNNDITERKSFQRELDKNEAMFHTMVDWTYNWEYWLSPDHKIIYMTPSVERVTGYTPEEFSASPQLLSLIVHENDLALWEHLIDWNGPSNNNSIKDVKFRIMRKNSEIRWINATCRQVTDGHACVF